MYLLLSYVREGVVFQRCDDRGRVALPDFAELNLAGSGVDRGRGFEQIEAAGMFRA